MKIAVIIPTLNEAKNVAGAVESALVPGAEVWVVDGGSGDDTLRRAERAGARVLRATAGRSRQLQVGFEASDGEIVLFLHADTQLPSGWADAVRGALQDPDTAGGAFRFRFDRQTPALRLVEWGARLRSDWLRLPYGDQASFVRRALLGAMGGIPSAPLMEDLDLVMAIRERGRLALLSESATTSARRHLAAGVLRTSLYHSAAALAWAAGVRRERIAAWLRRLASRRSASRHRPARRGKRWSTPCGG